MLRRSDFIAATYALSFVFANFGIAIAARMPMITTTIKSSIRVKPFLLRIVYLLWARREFTVHAFDGRACGVATNNGGISSRYDPFCNCLSPNDLGVPGYTR